VDKSFVQGFIAIGQVGVLANNRDFYATFWMPNAIYDLDPFAKVGLFVRWQTKAIQHLRIQSFPMIGQRNS
jgi:hypothetical protein